MLERYSVKTDGEENESGKIEEIIAYDFDILKYVEYVKSLKQV